MTYKISAGFAVAGSGKLQKETAAAASVGIRAQDSETRRISPCESSQNQLRGIDWRAECSFTELCATCLLEWRERAGGILRGKASLGGNGSTDRSNGPQNQNVSATVKSRSTVTDAFLPRIKRQAGLC